MYTFIPAAGISPTEEQSRTIRNFLKKRKISYLTHFTRVDNVRSILRLGILPRAVVQGNKSLTSVKLSDRGLPAAWGRMVPFNLSFPDYKLFSEIEGSDLSEGVVMLIDAKVLCDYPFYYLNDRASDIITTATVPDELMTDRMHVKDLMALFDDQEDVKRDSLDLLNCYPTNPRSELLSFFPIPPSYISQVCFTNEYKFNQWFLHNTEFALSLNVKDFWACGLQYFSPRSDSSFWKTQGIHNKK